MSMGLVEELQAAHGEVVADAAQALQRAHLRHYEAVGPEESRRRLDHLYGLVLECLTERTLVPICEMGEKTAIERFESGYDIGEVQTAFNVLEEAIWHVVIARMPPVDLVEATGLVGTVLGAGKDALARTWVSLASKHHVSSLDLTALFGGTKS